MSDLARLAADLAHAASAIERASHAVVHATALRLETRLRVAGDLASGVGVSFPAPGTAVIGGVKRFGVAAEAGAKPINISAGDVQRSAEQIAAGLSAAAARLTAGHRA